MLFFSFLLRSVEMLFLNLIVFLLYKSQVIWNVNLISARFDPWFWCRGKYVKLNFSWSFIISYSQQSVNKLQPTPGGNILKNKYFSNDKVNVSKKTISHLAMDYIVSQISVVVNRVEVDLCLIFDKFDSWNIWKFSDTQQTSLYWWKDRKWNGKKNIDLVLEKLSIGL